MSEAIATGTLAHYQKIVRSMFSAAHKQGLLLVNPCDAIESPRIKRNERSVLRPEEVRALLSVSGPEWRTLIVIAYYSGPRLRDCASLDWSAVDLARGVITFRQGKTGRKVIMPLHPALSDHLFSIAGDQAGPLCPVLSETRTSALSSGRTANLVQLRV